MEDTEERKSALDEFASMSNAPVATMQIQNIQEAEYSRGAVKVAVYRDEARVFQKLKAAAAYAGTDFFYRFPVKNRKENRTDWIEGPSIKLANELARIYGNCKAGVRAIDNGDSWIFSATFIDIESGFELVRPFQQRKSAGKIGGADEERRLDIAFQIGASKAIRNVVVNALQTFADFALNEARNALVERIGKDLAGYRERTSAKLSGMVSIDRVEAVVGKPVKDWLAPDVARVIAMATSVAEGMSNLNETFPPIQDTTNSSSTGQTLDAFSAAEAGADQSSVNKEATRADPGSEPSEDVGAAGNPIMQSDPAADLLQTIRERMANAPTEAAVEQVWEQLDLDVRFENDARGRAEANKIMAKRLKEIRNG
jgi:hypothetical protein